MSLLNYTSDLLATIILFVESFNDTGEELIKLCAQTLTDYAHFEYLKCALLETFDKDQIIQKLVILERLCPQPKKLLVLLNLEGTLFFR